MHSISINKSTNTFESKGKPFFYLADTVWSAFTNIYYEDWEEYLEYRRMQGFNALQINILPQWDRSMPDLGYRPFKVDSTGKTDFYSIEPGYFDHAAKMLESVVRKGFVPALVVLWCDFVNGTWGSRVVPDHVMPLDAVKPYVEYVLNTTT